MFELPNRLIINKRNVSIDLQSDGKIILVRFKYNKDLITEIKNMVSARWDPEGKYWKIDDCQHNRFQLAYLSGVPVYERYDNPLLDYTSKRPLHPHQLLAVRHIITRKQCELAAEQGVGKTLVAIEVIEYFGWPCLWIGPKSALFSVNLEFAKWKAKIKPVMLTYEGMKEVVKYWPESQPPPKLIVFDEASRLKNPMAQRTQVAQYLTDCMRDTYGDDCVILEMSGAPAPKSPFDWYSQIKIARPGYLKEGSERKFKDRLCWVEQRQSLAGGTYPHLVSWKDDENKCAECGRFADDVIHDPINEVIGEGYHIFQKSINEVAFLYKRMKGIVLVQSKEA